MTSSGNRFCNIKVINTITNADGITLQGANNVVERCTFDLCRDEAVGITGASARGNIVAFSRIENCGSQPGDGTNWANGRGILVTTGGSATLVGNYVYHCNRGITTNSANGFSDMRNCRIESSLSPASGNGATIDGPAQGNMMNSVSSNNILNGFRLKLACTFYRTGLTGSGNALSLISIDADCTESGSVLTRADTPFPAWLSGATTPASGNDVGMGTGDCQCIAGGGQTKATNPNPANGSTSVSITADLSWTAGAEADSHDVYFGTNSSSPTFQGNQAGTTFDTGTMANSTTYYWRIDEVGAETLTGDLWSFTTVAGVSSPLTIYSTAGQDGYMRESTETSGVGGFADTTGNLRVGDTNAKLQQIGIYSFDTSAIPDGATITAVTFTIFRYSVSGTPTSLGDLLVDIKNGYYGTDSTLVMGDFEAASSATAVGTLPYPTANKVAYSCSLNASGIANINKTGLTQLKVRFATDDDNDTANDYLSLYTGENANYPPYIVVTWQ